MFFLIEKTQPSTPVLMPISLIRPVRNDSSARPILAEHQECREYLLLRTTDGDWAKRETRLKTGKNADRFSVNLIAASEIRTTRRDQVFFGLPPMRTTGKSDDPRIPWRGLKCYARG